MRWTSLAGVVALASALAACSFVGTSGSPTSSPAASPPAATAAPATPGPEHDHVIIDCNLVFADDQAAALTPPLIPVPTFAPAAGSLGAAMVDAGGKPCGWGTDATTASLEVVVAIPTETELTAAKASASTGQVAHSLRSDTIYFAVADGVGRAQVFFGSYWIEVASSAFTTPDQAEAVYDLVIQDLRSAGG